MSISSEFLESIISTWAKNLWMLNNQARIHDDQSRQDITQRFYDLYYPDDRGLTHTQRLSERGFVGLCQGLVYLERVLGKASDAISKNRLVDAWRQSVLKNGFQQRYGFFEKTLKDTIDIFGADAAVAQYPTEISAAADDVIEALQTMRYASKALDPKIINDLLRQAEKDAAGNLPKPAPKGPQTK